MTKKITTETEFVSSLKATDKNGNIVTGFQAEPYLTIGMYVSIAPHHIQICPSHREYPKWVADSISKMEEQGYTITTTKSTYGAFFSQEYIDEYINK